MNFTTRLAHIATFLVATVLIAVSAVPAPLALDSRDVFDPPVLFPHAGTVWIVGQHHNVTWDASNPPADLSDPVGLILLRKSGETTPVILANGFSILAGRVEVTVPWVIDGDDYSIILLGDSGNDSQDFTIQSA